MLLRILRIKAYGPSDCYMQSYCVKLLNRNLFLLNAVEAFVNAKEAFVCAKEALCSRGTRNLGRFDSRLVRMEPTGKETCDGVRAM